MARRESPGCSSGFWSRTRLSVTALEYPDEHGGAQMPTLTIEYRDEDERLALEQAIAYVSRACVRLAIDAPAGTVLEACEGLALEQGPRLAPLDPRRRPGAAGSPSAEQKGGRTHSAPRRTPGAPRGRHRRTVLTAVGPVTLDAAISPARPARRATSAPTASSASTATSPAGPAGWPACWASQRSFAEGRGALARGGRLGPRRQYHPPLCHATAARASSTRERRATAEAFARAEGDLELQIDAGKVNTLEGWRDVKVAVFARRRAGRADHGRGVGRARPAGPDGAFGGGRRGGGRGIRRAVARPRRSGWSLTDPGGVQRAGRWGGMDLEPGRGAFPRRRRSAWTIWHGAGHLADGAKAAFGSGSDEAGRQLERGKQRLLEDGYWGVTEWVGELAARVPLGGDGAALGGVLNYFAGHQARLNYALRLRRGQSIGSGLVEGSIKQLLNVRLKQTGARWKVEHVAPLVELGALSPGRSGKPSGREIDPRLQKRKAEPQSPCHRVVDPPGTRFTSCNRPSKPACHSSGHDLRLSRPRTGRRARGGVQPKCVNGSLWTAAGRPTSGRGQGAFLRRASISNSATTIF